MESAEGAESEQEGGVSRGGGVRVGARHCPSSVGHMGSTVGGAAAVVVAADADAGVLYSER